MIWQKFKISRRGASSVEFAFLIIPVLAVFFATLYCGYYLIIASSLSYVASHQARLISTGQQAAIDEMKSDPESAFDKAAAALLTGVIPTGNFTISVKSFPTIESIQPGPATSGYSPGGPNDYVIVTASYDLGSIINPTLFTGESWSVFKLPTRISSTVITKNENF